MDDSIPKIKIQDLSGIGPWIEQHGFRVDLEREDNGRVVGFVPGTDEVCRLMAEYQGGPTVDLLDFLTFQRRLRGRLLDLRDNNGQRRMGHGKRPRSF